MIAGIFHKGSGLGNQLHRYVATRCAALDGGYEFGMVNPEGFKGASFMKLDIGVPINADFTIQEPSGRVVPQLHFMKMWEEKKIIDRGADVREYDESIKKVPNQTLIDGEFQDERYWQEHKDKVREWLKVEPLDMPEDVCVINFRGGEYVGLTDLFLPQKYWHQAIAYKREQGVKYFIVVTDDPDTARQFFPNFVVKHDMAMDWRMIRYAYHLILSNSSFAILPAWLNENCKEVVAPKYWGRHNLGFWSMRQNEYKGWTYL